MRKAGVTGRKKENEERAGVSCAVDFAVAVRSALRVATPGEPSLPTAAPRRWQPVTCSYFASTTNIPFKFQQPPVHCLLLIYRLSAYKILHPPPIVISTNHLEPEPALPSTHFPFHRCLHHSHLPFSSGLIFPYWLVTFVHVHAACTHLNLVYLYQPIVIGEAFRLFVILLLLALPCLNSFARCVITCPIWLNKPRQRGLEVFMNLSQMHFRPQAAAILTSSGFFLPHRFHKW